MTTLTWYNVKGTEIRVGDYVFGDSSEVLAVNAVVPGQHELGAKYADVTLEDGSTKRCWEGFIYRAGR